MGIAVPGCVGRPVLAALALAGVSACAGPGAAQKAAEARWCVEWATEQKQPAPDGVVCPRPEHSMKVLRFGVYVCRCEREAPSLQEQ